MFSKFSNISLPSFPRLPIGMLIAALVMCGITPAKSDEVPSNLEIVGQITAGSSGLTMATGDGVDVVLASNLNKVEGAGTVIADDGTYFISMSKGQSYNGTQLALKYKKSGSVYRLNAAGSPAVISYAGGFPFPARLQINLTVGDKLSGGGGGGGGGGSGGGGGGTVNDTYDVNGDGIFNQADINDAKSKLGKSNVDGKYDVNSDGIFNTRDIVDMIRARNSTPRITPPATTDTTTTTQ